MYIVVMPKLGFNMDEGKLTTWYKKEGESVKKSEPLFEIETDKTAIDVEATQDGIVRAQFITEGETVPVILPIAIIADANEDIAEAEANARAELAAGMGGNTPAAPKPAPAAAPVKAADPAPAPAPAAPAASAVPKAGGIALGDPAYDFDVFIIGGGPGGYVAAIRAGQLGLRAAVAEKDTLGGVCLNRGCIPTKTFLRSAETFKDVRKVSDFGITGVDASKAALDMKKVQTRKKEIVGGLVGGVESLLKKNKVTSIKGEAKIIDKNTIEVGGKKYKTANLIIATGTDVQLPEDIVKTKKYLTSDNVLNMTKLPEDIVIIGAGVIAVEFAYFMASVGVKTTIVVRSRVLRVFDTEIADMVQKDLESLGVTVYGGAQGIKATDNGVEFEKDGKKTVLKTKNILVAIGRVPVVTEDALALGIKTENGAIVTDEYLRTNVEGVYAIGDVNGKDMLAHKASAEGVVAVETIAGHPVKMDYSAIPNVIYIKPEVATVGLTEEEARAKYGNVKVGRFPIMANGKSHVDGDKRGIVKVIAEPEYGEIVGAHLYCLHASDMIAEMVTAMRGEMTIEDVARAVHPHPTVVESVQEAAMAAAHGVAIHC
jgi:dihydrolipoamide dehydrogenase